MKRQKILVGYKTDLTTGTVFSEYRKEIVEDDESITYDGIHRQTITSEDYDALKKLKFADVVALGHVKSIDDLAKQVEVIKAEKAEIAKLSAEAIALRDAQIATLKKK